MTPEQLTEAVRKHAKTVLLPSVARAIVEELTHEQAKIDALMLEFCPGEMTAEQIDEWMKHQVVSDPKAPEVQG